MAPNIKKRVLVGTPMFAALIGLFLLDSVAAQHGLGGLPPLILGWILISIGGYEAAQLLRSSGLAADRFLIPIGAAFFMTSLLAVHMQYVSLMILSIFGVGFPAVAMIRPVLEGDLGKATATAAASTGIVVYLGAGLGSIFALQQDAGAIVALMAVLAIKSCDIGAYFSGHWFGRTPLAPSVSPAKTVEGLLGGHAFFGTRPDSCRRSRVGHGFPATIVWGGHALGRVGADWRSGGKRLEACRRSQRFRQWTPWDRGRARCVGFPDVRRSICMVDDERVRHRGRDRLDSTLRPCTFLNHHFRRFEPQ